MDPLKELMTAIGQNNTPSQLGEQVAPYSEPIIQQLQQLYQQLFGPKLDPNADMVNDPIGGGAMSRSPLKNRIVGRGYQDPSMGMGY